MPILQSRVDTRSESFQTARRDMIALIGEVRALEAHVRAWGEKRAEKYHSQGRLTPRERVEHLLDPGAPFLELSTLAGLHMHDDVGGEGAMGGGSIAGIGFVSGVRCLISASDSAIKGGTIAPMGLEKSLRSQALALENKLPSIHLIESGGANLSYQSELFIKGGRAFCNMARLSAAGLPQVTVVHGSATAGGAYMPGLSDYVIAVKGRARIFLAGPPLVKAAIGEDSTAEELGGAEMHATVSGLAEYLAEDDAHGIALAREVVATLGWDRCLPSEEPRFLPPRYSPDELCGVVPADPKFPYDVREVIARIVDDSDFLEFKAGYGADTVCGHAAVEGHRIALIGNAGPIQPEGATKAAQFIQLCCQSGTPIVYLQNTTGYMVGKDVEQRGAIKHGAKMIQAVANATVPQITFMIGGGYGAGNYGMCGRSYDPRFVFAWPNSKVAVMGGAQAATVMEIITRASFLKKGLPLQEDALKAMGEHIRNLLDRESSALFATARLWDDGIIDPRDTRDVLAFALRTIHEASRREVRPNTFGVARL
jgi:geranyl-CoA carboxylase beta subunit